ncbi:MAG: MBL fold metallo-hydrolase, partial [Verrucomicrobia bacterium]
MRKTTMPFTRKALVTSALVALAGLSAAENRLEGDRIATSDGDVIIHPINHATFVTSWKDKTIYADPVGGGKRFDGLPKPDLILVTDIHGDHLDAGTLEAIAGSATIVAPAAVAEKLPEKLRKQTTVLANGETKTVAGVGVEALPMYNLTADRLKFHNKGRGNGYVV